MSNRASHLARLGRVAALGLALCGPVPAAFAEAANDDATAKAETTEADAKADDGKQEDAETLQKALCDLIETAATDNGLPIGYFTRLIWTESRFRGDALSPKGAQGIAQFMPGTAAMRGLEDPFDTVTALPASAAYLAELKRRFGNLGLAAAAYNAGENRVDSWLADNSTLPYETERYVLTVTGVPAADWADPESGATLPAEPEDAKDCVSLAALLKRPGFELTPEIETARAPWGVQVAGGYSKARTIAAYSAIAKRFSKLFAGRPPMLVRGRVPGRGSRAYYRIRVPAETRKEAERFCADLKKAGGVCIVLKT